MINSKTFLRALSTIECGFAVANQIMLSSSEGGVFKSSVIPLSS